METLNALESFALAMMRVTVFLVVAPPFSNRAIPGNVKAMLGVGLALALSPTTDVASEGTGEFLGRLLVEAVAGAGLGVLVLTVVAAVQAAGRMIDVLGGFELGAAFDPLTMTQGAPFGRLYQFAAVVLLFVSDGYQLVVLGLARTFELVPLGVGLDTGALAEALTGSAVQMFLAALQIAGPLMAVLFLADVGLGLLTRVAPALNAFALGFPLKILITLTLSSVAILALPGVVSWIVDDALDRVLEVIR